MCGIFAYAGEGHKDVSAALSQLSHRGPDHQAALTRGAVTLGHCRLSIIDISDRGNQPMTSSSQRTIITFNGEIYNYRILREELMREGAVFATESDTEVILEGYERHGAAFFEKLRGMWAFVLHDSEKKEMVLARDPFGIKPLYYAARGRALHAASELRALKASGIRLEPDPEAYKLFFNLGYFLAPSTPYKNVSKLLPGEVAIWNIHSGVMRTALRVSRFAEVPPYQGHSYAEALDALDAALTNSVEAHYVSDVPVSLLLSGGTDSSLIAALSRKLGKSPAVFHVATPGSIDTDYAEKIARELGLSLSVERLTEQSFAEEYERVWDTLDEPTADISIIPTSLVFRAIHGKSKVVLSGDGGDELFGGYLRSRMLMKHSRIAASNPLNSLFNSLMSPSSVGLAYVNPVVQRLRGALLGSGAVDDLVGAYLKTTRTLDHPLYDREVRGALTELSVKERDDRIPAPLLFDTTAYLPNDILPKTDNASMASSIEARVPFVDRALWSAVHTVGIQASPDKRVLKDVLKRYLPADLVDRPKKGFGVPVASYDRKKFDADFDAACAFHLNHRDSFGLDASLARLLAPRSRPIIARKYPRFAFGLISSWKLLERPTKNAQRYG